MVDCVGGIVVVGPCDVVFGDCDDCSFVVVLIADGVVGAEEVVAVFSAKKSSSFRGEQCLIIPS